jgi:hypothetical protein
LHGADVGSQTILPPRASDPARPGALGRTAHRPYRICNYHTAPLNAYLAEAEPRNRIPWCLYGWFMRHVAPSPRTERAVLPPPQGPIETRWETSCYQHADRLSVVYGDRYRSCYMMIFLLAGLALIAAVVGLVAGNLPRFALRAEQLATGLEMAALGGIGSLVLANHFSRWHERWISYRLAAEV